MCVRNLISVRFAILGNFKLYPLRNVLLNQTIDIFASLYTYELTSNLYDIVEYLNHTEPVFLDGGLGGGGFDSCN